MGLDPDGEPIKVDVITRCFKGLHNKTVFKLRYFVMFFFIGLGIAASLVATGIGPLSKEENFLPENDPLIVLIDDISNRFSSATGLKESIMVKINWGIKDLDRSNVGLWDARNAGELIWDDDFTVSPARNQAALIDLCVDLRDKSPLVQNHFVTCWILDMDTFVQSKYQTKLPIEDEALFDNLLLEFT